MILSMTGYGSAEHAENNATYALEVRSLNHRYLKLSFKLPETLQFAESVIEKLLRDKLSRGSVSLSLRTRLESLPSSGVVNLAVLQAYVDGISQVKLPEGINGSVDLGVLAGLPGVCQTPDYDAKTRQAQLVIIEKLVSESVDALVVMRRDEGRALRDDILAICGEIRSFVAEVGARSPLVVEEYHERLKARVNTLMNKGGFELAAEGLMREVAIYAERCDIAEELTRLTAHLDQFGELCDAQKPVGRTLDFLSQELLREANTIASKANDAKIAQCVVAMKGLIDRVKEQVQNVE